MKKRYLVLMSIVGIAAIPLIRPTASKVRDGIAALHDRIVDKISSDL